MGKFVKSLFGGGNKRGGAAANTQIGFNKLAQEQLREQLRFEQERTGRLDVLEEQRFRDAQSLEQGRFDQQLGFFEDALAREQERFDIGFSGLQPFIESGTEALGGLEGLISGQTAGGLDARLAEIFDSDIFGSLVDERTRAVQNQLAAGGLTRSGTALQEAARVPTDIGLGIENQLFGRQSGLLSGLAGGGLQAALGVGGLGGSIGGAPGQGGAGGIGQLGIQGLALRGGLPSGANQNALIAQLFSQSGAAGASGQLVDAQQRAKQAENLRGMFSSIGGSTFGQGLQKAGLSSLGFGAAGAGAAGAGAAGAGAGALGAGALGAGAGAGAAAGGAGASAGALAGAAFIFSDPDLKENIEQIGNVHDLKLYQWDWRAETRGTFIADAPTVGFMADEVEEFYPQFVGTFASFRFIDYPGLTDYLDELEEAA